jgi:von Willebrand factor type A domain/Aerotolerance regulator N-terminal
MNFANPTSLLWAGLAIPIVIFYILKIRLRRVPVSTTLFWQQIFEEKQPRAIWQHLRHLLSLLVQLAFLCLLVLALAEPFFNWEATGSRRLALVIDNSGSMRATDGAPTRLDEAKERGRRILDGLGAREEVAIVAAGTQPQVVCGLTGHVRTLRAALDAVPATDGPTRVADAVALARRLLSGREGSTVIVLTDGCFEGALTLAEAPDVQMMPVGRRTGNVGITRFQVRRSLVDPIGYEILAEVSNCSDEQVECRLEVELNGDVVDVVPLKIAADGRWAHVFEKTSADGGRLIARINRPDALMADNEAQALLPKREYQPLTLVTEGDVFLEKVFEANPLVRLTVSKDLSKAGGAGVVSVFHRKVPAALPVGPVLVIDPANSCDLWQVGDKLLNPIVTKQDKDSPLMAHVKLDNVVMPEARKLKFKDSVQVLAAALSGDPLYVAIDRPQGKVLVLTVNLDQGDLPLRTAFPIMATNALAWFSGTRGELRESVAAGAVAEVEVPLKELPADSALLLRGPDGADQLLPRGASRMTIGPLDRCGFWSIVLQAPARSTDARVLYEVACNLASRAESDLRPPEGLPVGAGKSAAAGFGVQPIWFYLIAAAWLLTGLEWCLYQRRTIT